MMQVKRILIAIVMLSATVLGADVADYKRRVDSARTGVGDLIDNVAQIEAGETPAVSNEEITAEILKLLPTSEKIEGPGGSVDTSNQWLKSALENAANEPDTAKRAVMLTEAKERLAALSVKLEGIRNPAAGDRSKDEDKRKLAEILNRSEYQKPAEKQETLVEKWMRQFREWLASWFPSINPQPSTFGGFGSLGVILQYVLIAGIVVLLGFVVYKLLPLFAPRFRRGAKKEKTDRVILGEKIGRDQSPEDLFGEAERLAREGNLRGAIRKGYIALLCELSDRKVIGLAQHKTNRDYLRDVRSRRELHDEMRGLTGSFEAHWYGFKEAERGDWDEFRRRYGEATRAL